MHRNPSVSVHQFAMIPKADIPRSKFKMQKGLKTTFDAGKLIPIFVEEVLPGDTWKLRMTAFVRLATPLFPVMDNLHMETFFFFVPNRLVWVNWKKFMGEQANPSDSISYLIPTKTSSVGGFPIMSLYDYMGLPTAGQVDPAQTVAVNALPLRAYNLIFNEWFRDENLVNSLTVSTADGPDVTAYTIASRGKRKDYFTGCLPWPQKGNVAVTIPLGTSAPVKGLGIDTTATTFATSVTVNETGGASPTYADAQRSSVTPGLTVQLTGPSSVTPNIYADLTAAAGATINQLRQSFQIQKLLERDARGGTRYAEIVRSHFGVVSPDARLQRPEYLGGGHTPIIINPVAQTSATGISGGATPTGNLAAIGTGLANGHGFTQSFTEHGYIIGLINVRADLTYQQGLRRHWSRSTRYDFYFPAFAHLGEQAILNKEIYCRGDSNDSAVFGYQERWAEYRYNPSEITGLFRSTSAGTIDPWHLAQKFTSLPTLNATFITEDPPLSRILAVTSTNKQMLADIFYDMTVARPLPMYSVPGLIDHF